MSEKRARSTRQLLNYWRSSSSWRVRLALSFKGLEYEYKPINLLKGEEGTPEYFAMNPAGVPTFIDDNGDIVTQSMAIMEYLEEKYPERPLLPRGFHERSQVRSIALQIVSGVQPLQNLAVLNKVAASFGGEAAKTRWAKEVIEEGMHGVDVTLQRTAGTHCFGDSFTMADCCLIPQAYACRRFGVDLSQFPAVHRVLATLEASDLCRATHPDAMPDAVKA